MKKQSKIEPDYPIALFYSCNNGNGLKKNKTTGSE